jgi:hypothetical protein
LDVDSFDYLGTLTTAELALDSITQIHALDSVTKDWGVMDILAVTNFPHIRKKVAIF